MTRKLLIVSASGLLLAIALLAAAWLAGGHRFVTDMEKHGGNWSFDFDDDDKPAGPQATRSLAYDGSTALTIEAPVDLTFTRGANARMTVEGPRGAIDALRLDGGRLYLDGTRHSMRRALKVTIVAPQIPGVVLKGAGNVELNGLEQPALAIELAGAGNIEGSGKVGKLTITGDGVGNIDLAKVEAIDAKVTASGIGNIDLNASGKVDLNVSGAGNISLHSKPRELTSRVSGIGSIDHDY